MSIQRILGTGIGVLVASVWVNLVGLTWWSFAIGVLVSLLVARLLPWSIGGQMQIPVAVIFVLALGPGSLSADLWRVVDVVIGGVVGLAAVFVVPGPAPAGAVRDRPRGPIATASCGRCGRWPTNRAGMSSRSTMASGTSYVASRRNLRALADKARAELVALVESAHWQPALARRRGGVRGPGRPIATAHRHRHPGARHRRRCHPALRPCRRDADADGRRLAHAYRCRSSRADGRGARRTG